MVPTFAKKEEGRKKRKEGRREEGMKEKRGGREEEGRKTRGRREEKEGRKKRFDLPNSFRDKSSGSVPCVST